MRYTGVLIAGLLMMFGLNASHAFLLPEADGPSVQEKEKAEEQKKDDEKEEVSKDEDAEHSNEKKDDSEEDAKPDATAAAVEAVKAVSKEYDAKYEAFLEVTKKKSFSKDYRKAAQKGRDAARAFLTKAGMPDAEEYSKRMEEVAAVSMAFIASNGRGPKSTAAMDYLFEHHAGDEMIEPLISRAGLGVPPKKAKARFRAVMNESSSEKLQGLATIGLAEMIAGEEPEDTTEVEELFQTVVDKYASIESRGSTLGERAEKALFAMKYLRIGAVAPDIEAEDIEGVEFKLSDYRGKVVLLDFWGDW